MTEEGVGSGAVDEFAVPEVDDERGGGAATQLVFDQLAEGPGVVAGGRHLPRRALLLRGAPARVVDALADMRVEVAIGALGRAERPMHIDAKARLARVRQKGIAQKRSG